VIVEHRKAFHPCLESGTYPVDTAAGEKVAVEVGRESAEVVAASSYEGRRHFTSGVADAD
jgi:hypothetical protein